MSHHVLHNLRDSHRSHRQAFSRTTSAKRKEGPVKYSVVKVLAKLREDAGGGHDWRAGRGLEVSSFPDRNARVGGRPSSTVPPTGFPQPIHEHHPNLTSTASCRPSADIRQTFRLCLSHCVLPPNCLASRGLCGHLLVLVEPASALAFLSFMLLTKVPPLACVTDGLRYREPDTTFLHESYTARLVLTRSIPPALDGEFNISSNDNNDKNNRLNSLSCLLRILPSLHTRPRKHSYRNIPHLLPRQSAGVSRNFGVLHGPRSPNKPSGQQAISFQSQAPKANSAQNAPK
ncbi:hypothetical protein BKA80DRAFT_53979 [Phyllosticta citrichinensis]